MAKSLAPPEPEAIKASRESNTEALRDEKVLFLPNAGDADAQAEGKEAVAATRDSFGLADWELEPDEEETAPKPASADWRERVERMSREEADALLAELVEHDGRLKITVPRRPGKDPITGYVRMMDGDEAESMDLIYSRTLHRLRKGSKEQSYEDGMLSTAEFIVELLAKMPEHQKQAIERIQNDPELATNPIERNRQIMEVFQESPYLGLVQHTADVYAASLYYDQRVIHGVEVRAIVTGGEGEAHETWEPLWKSVREFRREDSDVRQAVISEVLLAQAKLADSRFLSFSSDDPSAGVSTNGSAKNTASSPADPS